MLVGLSSRSLLMLYSSNVFRSFREKYREEMNSNRPYTMSDLLSLGRSKIDKTNPPKESSTDLVLKADSDSATADDFIKNLISLQLEDIDTKQHEETRIRLKQQHKENISQQYYKKAKKTLSKIWKTCGKKRFGHKWVNLHLSSTGSNIDVCKFCGYPKFTDSASTNSGIITYKNDLIQNLATKLQNKDKEAGLIPKWEETMEGIKYG